MSGYRLSFYGEAGATEWNLKMANTLLEQDATISEVAFLCNSKAPGQAAEYFRLLGYLQITQMEMFVQLMQLRLPIRL